MIGSGQHPLPFLLNDTVTDLAVRTLLYCTVLYMHTPPCHCSFHSCLMLLSVRNDIPPHPIIHTYLPFLTLLTTIILLLLPPPHFTLNRLTSLSLPFHSTSAATSDPILLPPPPLSPPFISCFAPLPAPRGSLSVTLLSRLFLRRLSTRPDLSVLSIQNCREAQNF